MDEMTSREIEEYFENGGDLILIPFGPISGHGANTTIGMHGHWAEALSLLIAQKANGLVYPIVNSCFAGATRTFRGTVSFTIAEQTAILTKIACILLEQGFKRIVLVAGTNPEDTGGLTAARDVFDLTEKPVWFIIARQILDTSEAKKLFDNYPGRLGEAVIDQASLKILGRQRPIPYPEWAKRTNYDESDQPAEIMDDIKELRRWGNVGFRYFEERQHGLHGTVGLTHNGVCDIDLAVEVLEKCADTVLPALHNLSHYCEWIANQPYKYIIPVDHFK
jgi:hypothetical protein